MKKILLLITLLITINCYLQINIIAKYYTDYKKDKTINQQGAATYMIIIKNASNSIRVVGPNNFDMYYTVSAYWSTGTADNFDLIMTWIVTDPVIIGFKLVINGGVDGYWYEFFQFYDNDCMRKYTKISFLK